jgi:hypothetical protein
MTDEEFRALCNVYGFAPSRALRELLDTAIGQAAVVRNSIAYIKELEMLNHQALEALKMMRDKYGEYACPACDHADAAISALKGVK